MPFNNIEDIIKDIHDRKMVILMDDEDRENEGDLVIAASCITPEYINFMARYGRGLICLTLTEEHCQRLNLPLMVRDSNKDQRGTNFTISIEAAEGVTTGISAADRAKTVLAAVNPNAQPDDLVQPGHIFPLMAQSGGVLTRAGHTEAGCDLARLAGLGDAAVIVEILNEDGTMARRADLEYFAQQHGLHIGTIADLISYRLHHEKSIEHLYSCRLPTEFAAFQLHAYRDHVHQQVHLAMVLGDIDPEEPTLVRVHLPDTLRDLLHGKRADSGMPIRNALEHIACQGKGVFVLLREAESEDDLLQRIRSYHDVDQARTTPDYHESHALRTYGIGAQILLDIGVRRMRVMGAPRKFHALSGFGLEVVDYEAC